MGPEQANGAYRATLRARNWHPDEGGSESDGGSADGIESRYDPVV